MRSNVIDDSTAHQITLAKLKAKLTKQHIQAAPPKPNTITPHFAGSPNAELFGKLPLLMQDAIAVLKEMRNCPDEMALQAVLGAVNFACQHHYQVDCILYDRPMSLYLLAIAPTGGMKSTIYGDVMEGAERWLQRERDRYTEEKAVHKVVVGQYERELRIYSKNPVGNPPDEPKPVQTARFISEVGTRNGIIDVLQYQPTVGLFNDDGGDFFNSYSFRGGKDGKNQSIEMTAFLTKLYEKGIVSRQTGIDSIHLQNRRMCMLFMLQEAVIKDVLLNDTFARQGFIHRLLITHSAKFEKPAHDYSSDGLRRINDLRIRLRTFNDRIEALLNQGFKLHPDRDFELNLPLIHPNADALELMQEFYNKYKDGGLFPNDTEQRWTDFETRLHEFPCRLAANLAVFEGKTEIDLNSMEAGIRLFMFYVDQRKTLDMTQEALKSPFVECAEQIIRWMANKGLAEVTLNKLVQTKVGYINGYELRDRNKIVNILESDFDCAIEKRHKSIVIKRTV
jgi:hypothetical protein